MAPRRSHQPTPDQPAFDLPELALPAQILPESPSPVRQAITHDPLARRAFGSLPAYLAFGRNEAITVTSEDETHASQPYLEASLWHPYESGVETDHVVDGVPLNSAEFTLIPRSVRAVRAAVKAKTNDANVLAKPLVENEAILRSELHTIQGYLPKQTTYFGSLTKQIAALRAIHDMAPYPGFRRGLTEADMRQIVGVTWDNVENILTVTKNLRGWTSDEAVAANEVLRRAVSTGPQSARVANLSWLVTISLGYAQNRREVFRHRVNELSRSEAQITQKLTDFYSNNGLTSR